MSNIKDIVEQVQETPSPRCWESIASQLPAAGTAIGGGAAATAAKGSIAAGKLAAIIGSAAAVVTVVTVTTVALLKNEPATDLQANADNTLVATAIDTTSTDDTTLYIAEETSLPASSNEPSVPASTTSKGKENLALSSTPAPRSETAQVAPTPSTTTPATTATSATAGTTTSSPKTEPSQVQQNTTVATPHTNPSHSQAESGTTGKQQEPAAETAEDNYSGYSQPIVIEIPNIFTPNGDGMNDLFVIKGIEHCDKRMLIVKDQKGQTVFQSQHYDNNWDGGDLSNGSYYYQFVYSINNINEQRKGTVLIRR